MEKTTHCARSFTHLNQSLRDRLEILLREGIPQKDIAQVLGVHPSTISREKRRKRREDIDYTATIAQQKARAKRASSKYCGMAVESDQKRKQYIIQELVAHRAPEEIARHIQREKLFEDIGKDAIYSWLYSTRGGRYAKYLCTKRWKRRPQKRVPKREMIPNRIGLEHRPLAGIHAQGDTFVSPKDTGTDSGVMVVIPEAQLMLGTKVEALRPVVVLTAMSTIICETRATDMTLDNGIENKHHEQLPIPAYFCQAHHPWEKPDVENAIGLLRRWFIRKGTAMRIVSEAQLQYYLHVLNGKYRKSLGDRSAYEVAVERGIVTKEFVEKKTKEAGDYYQSQIALGVRV